MAYYAYINSEGLVIDLVENNEEKYSIEYWEEYYSNLHDNLVAKRVNDGLNGAEVNVGYLYDWDENKFIPNIADDQAREVTPVDLLFAKNYIDKESRNKRLDICLGCDRLRKSVNVCRECGCFMALKTWLKDAKCPLNKWTINSHTSV